MGTLALPNTAAVAQLRIASHHSQPAYRLLALLAGMLPGQLPAGACGCLAVEAR